MRKTMAVEQPKIVLRRKKENETPKEQDERCGKEGVVRKADFRELDCLC
jgi:hypothetical protein